MPRSQQRKKCGLQTHAIMIIVIAVLGLLTSIVFLIIEAERMRKREQVYNCQYMDATILTKNITNQNLYLFRGRINGTFPDGSLMILNIYNKWKSYTTLPEDSFTSDKGQEECYFNDFRDDLLVFEGQYHGTNSITWCRVDQDDYTNFRVCWDPNPHNGWGQGLGCSEDTLEWRVGYFLIALLFAAPLITYGITIIVDICEDPNYMRETCKLGLINFLIALGISTVAIGCIATFTFFGLYKRYDDDN